MTRPAETTHTAPIPSIALGMIVHPRDRELLAHVLGAHAPAFDACCVVIDGDYAAEDDVRRTEALVRRMFEHAPERLHLAVHPLGRDFAAQRDRCADMNPCDWLFMLDADERIRVRTLKCIRPALAQVLASRPWVRVLGMPRHNSVDGRTPKVGQDWQFRLVRRDVRWRNTVPHLDASPGCHELPRELHDSPKQVMVLESVDILHDKSMDRQVEQNRFYGACV